jgi:ethanolamine utilization protein EutN
MQIGRVVGHATSTVKHPSLSGWRLLVLQLVNGLGKEDGEPLLAIDSLGAAVGSLVFATNDGASVREVVGSKTSPLRWMVLGICDS